MKLASRSSFFCVLLPICTHLLPFSPKRFHFVLKPGNKEDASRFDSAVLKEARVCCSVWIVALSCWNNHPYPHKRWPSFTNDAFWSIETYPAAVWRSFTTWRSMVSLYANALQTIMGEFSQHDMTCLRKFQGAYFCLANIVGSLRDRLMLIFSPENTI